METDKAVTEAIAAHDGKLIEWISVQADTFSHRHGNRQDEVAEVSAKCGPRQQA